MRVSPVVQDKTRSGLLRDARALGAGRERLSAGIDQFAPASQFNGLKGDAIVIREFGSASSVCDIQYKANNITVKQIHTRGQDCCLFFC
jgi:hypothetical protein